MRKLVLGLAMVVTMLAMVGCGTSKEEGFAPEQVVENEVVTDNVKENVEEIAKDDLTQYYDVEQYVGTPKLYYGVCYKNLSYKLDICYYNENNILCTMYSVTDINLDKLESGKTYPVITTDNNTPDDYTDDEVAYIFTTPIE